MRLRAHLLVAPVTDLASLDLGLFVPEAGEFDRIDPIGHPKMLDAFIRMPPAQPLEGDLAS